MQESKVSPVGSDKEIKVDVRVLAATNKNMQQEIEAGKFREDLYHRLSVIEIYVPPLDERKEDIQLLVSHFAKVISEEHGTAQKEFSADAVKALENFSWTGNIRELRNVVERLIIPVSYTHLDVYKRQEFLAKIKCRNFWRNFRFCQVTFNGT